MFYWESPIWPRLHNIEMFQCLLAFNIIINSQCYVWRIYICIHVILCLYHMDIPLKWLLFPSFSISNRTYFDNIVAIDSLLEHIMVSRFSFSKVTWGHEDKHAVLLSLICVTINAREMCAMKDHLSFVCHVLCSTHQPWACC